MVAPTVRYHVALVDRLPAGLEIINPTVANSETMPIGKIDDAPDERSYRQDRRWFEHQNLRDDRAEAFTTLPRDGVWNYSYAARDDARKFYRPARQSRRNVFTGNLRTHANGFGQSRINSLSERENVIAVSTKVNW
jgi:hypothetical protein